MLFFVLVILADILESLTTSDNALNLEDAKTKSGNDMLKVMQYVYPIVVNTQMDVIKKYGLPEGREGELTNKKIRSQIYYIINNINKSKMCFQLFYLVSTKIKK